MGFEPTGAARADLQDNAVPGAFTPTLKPNAHPYMSGAWTPQH